MGTPRFPLRRAVLEGIASVAECQHVIGATLLGTDGLVDAESPNYNGELTLVCSPPSMLRPVLGEGVSRMIGLLLGRILREVQRVFEEARPLFLAGALLSRLQPPPPQGDRKEIRRRSEGDRTDIARRSSDSYAYSVAHVDRANVASYDYSAVLYLNRKGDGFWGGDFCFVDDGRDEVVEPRPGRCVLFPSGFEHLHRVCSVSSGNRFALAAWFTLTATASDGAVCDSPHYEVHNPVPPLSDEEAEAAQVNMDALRAAVERKMASDSEVQALYGLG
uniref:Fe2OG dioxygenase domain-containing protein n=1 Tax=Haptolina brevifila TaxID=156173 RepID=A0A7S2HJ38_9EUKA